MWTFKINNMEPVLILCLSYIADWRKCKGISLNLVELCSGAEPDLNPALDLPGDSLASRGQDKTSPDHRDLSGFLVPWQVAVSPVLCNLNLTLSKERSNWGLLSVAWGCFSLAFGIIKNIPTAWVPLLVLISFWPLLFLKLVLWSGCVPLTYLKLIVGWYRPYFRLRFRLENTLFDETFHVNHSTDFTDLSQCRLQGWPSPSRLNSCLVRFG